jgi:hypothetical protein
VSGGIPAAHPGTAVLGSPGGDFCSSGFPARAHRCANSIALGVVFEGDRPPHPRPLSPVSRGRGEEEWSVGCRVAGAHARPRREAQGAAVVCCELPALLSTFSHLLSMAWMPWPPHPRPLSPVSRGRGEEELPASCRVGGLTRSREGRAVADGFRVRVRVPSARAD